MRRNRARILVAELVAGLTTIGLDQMHPLALVLDVGRNAVPGGSRAGKFVLLGHLQHGVPIVGRIVLRGGFRIRRDGRLQIDQSCRARLWTLGESTSP